MPARFYTHRCPECQLTYRVLLFVEKRVLYRVRCPDCRTRFFFDNRDGGLEVLPRRGLLKDAYREEELLPALDAARLEESIQSDGLLASSIERILRKQTREARTSRSVAEEASPPTPAEPEMPLQSQESAVNGKHTRDLLPGPVQALDMPPVGNSAYGPVAPEKPEPEILEEGPGRPSISLRPFFAWFRILAPGRFFSWLGYVCPAPGLARPYYLGLTAFFVLFGLSLLVTFPALVVLENTVTIERRMLPVEPNRIVDRDGRLLAELYSRRTSSLPLADYPLTLRQMLVYVEDQRFYRHNGLRLTSIARALFENTRAMRYIQGGSTITQQMARIVLGDRDRSLMRKMRELAVSLYLERRYPKDTILQSYMNSIYLGHGVYGLEMAARFYLGREVNELTFAEELLLVAILPAPEKYSPLRYPDRLAARMDRIYGRMLREKYPGRLAPSIYQKQKVALFKKFNRSPNENVFARRFDSAPYVTEHVRLALRRILGHEYEYDENLVIHTTLARPLQKAVTEITMKYIAEKSAAYPPRRSLPADSRLKAVLKQEYASAELMASLAGLPLQTHFVDELQAAMIGLNPETGEILFMQGGATFSPTNQFNRAVDMRRQTGSAIKPFVYAAAIESGKLTPSSILTDAPLNLGGRNSWEPKNYTGTYRGSVSVRQALRDSLNNPAVRVGMLVGLEGMGEQFRKFFFHTEDDFARRFRPDYTIAIGSLEMSPLEMAMAYSAFANNGVIARPYLIRRITDADRRILYTHEKKDEFNVKIPPTIRVIPGDVAHIMSGLLLESGQMGGVWRGGYQPNRPLMGKTGTSNDSRDAWFVGVLPGLAAAVWVGYDDSRFSMTGATGSTLAGPLWGQVIQAGLSRATYSWPTDFHFDPEAPAVALCARTGLLATAECPVRYERMPVARLPGHRCAGHGRPERGKVLQDPAQIRKMLERERGTNLENPAVPTPSVPSGESGPISNEPETRPPAGAPPAPAGAAPPSVPSGPALEKPSQAAPRIAPAPGTPAVVPPAAAPPVQPQSPAPVNPPE